MIGQADGSVASNLQFRRGDDFTTGATTMTLDGTGNVGIGTTGPGGGPNGWSPMLEIAGAFPGIRLNDNQGASASDWEISNYDGTFGILIGDSTANKYVISATSNGNVGIGTQAPSEKLDVSGNIKASGTVSQGSSKEFKKNISYVSTKDAMNAFNKLNPVRFEYKTDNSGEKHLGFIAEDVPDLVAEQDRKHLNAMDITAVLTKVVQEQQRIISELLAKVERLEGMLEKQVKFN